MQKILMITTSELEVSCWKYKMLAVHRN